MIKAVFVAEDDYYLGLRTGDVVELEEIEDGYIYTDEFGQRLFIERWEVEEISHD